MQSSLITYRIGAALLCHDVRLNTHIQIEVTLDHPPSPSEAESLLWPEAERVVARNFCEDCPYELYGVEVVARLLHHDTPAQLSLSLQETSLTNQSPQEEKIQLFRSLFKGREDVFPRSFVNTKTGKSGYAPVCRNEWAAGICQKPKIACQECNFRAFVPVSDEIIRHHMRGNDPNESSGKDFTMGIYPLLIDETCWCLAVDFDKSTWADDAKAFLETCRSYQVPAALERSRSGNGGPVWIFFETPVLAALARKLMTLLLTSTMNLRPEIGMDSYDRLFPSQDTMPKGGFGNLIALPLQKKPREQNNSVFVDQDLSPYSDQWTFLSSLQKMTPKEVERILKNVQDEGEITGVRAVVLEENEDEPWKLTSSRKYKEIAISGPFPDPLNMVIGNQIYIEKEGLPASLRNRIIRIAAFQNPEFYKAQAMHLSTFGKPIREIFLTQEEINALAHKKRR